MIRKPRQMSSEEHPLQGGTGAGVIQKLFLPSDAGSDTRLFSTVTLPAGASIGWHVHQGEEEFYYILTGSGEYSDNGAWHAVEAGDATLARSGEGHALKNTGSEPLTIVAVIEGVS